MYADHPILKFWERMFNYQHINSGSYEFLSIARCKSTLFISWQAIWKKPLSANCTLDWIQDQSRFSDLTAYAGWNALTLDICDTIRHKVVEDVVTPLVWLLESDPGFLQEIHFHVGPWQLASLVEVDANEFALVSEVEGKNRISYVLVCTYLASCGWFIYE